jgi:hypothetical protein
MPGSSPSSTHEGHDHKKRISRSLSRNWIIVITIAALIYYFVLRNLAN